MARPPVRNMESLPRSDEAEMGILSCFIQNPEPLLKDAAQNLPVEAFYAVTWLELYKSLLIMFRKKMPVDLVTISHFLTDNLLLDKIGGAATLAELYCFVPTPAHYPYYKGILLDKLQQRQILAFCEEMKLSCYANAYTEDWKSEALTHAAKITAQLTEPTKEERKLSHQVDQVREHWNQVFHKKITSGKPTRWKCWNEKLGGIKKGFILLLGPRKKGKSSLAQNIVTHLSCKKDPEPAAYFSYEMEVGDLIRRAVCDLANVESKYVFEPDVSEPDLPTTRRINEAMTRIEQAPMHLYYEPSWNGEDVVRELSRIRPVFSAVDYLQLMPSPDKTTKQEGFVREVAENSRILTRASGDLHMSIMCLSQINQEGEASWGAAPENDATLSLLINDEGVLVKNQRNGEHGFYLPVYLDGGFYRFKESEEEHHSDMP